MDKWKAVMNTTFGAAQPAAARGQFADLAIGGLLVVLAIGGLAL